MARILDRRTRLVDEKLGAELERARLLAKLVGQISRQEVGVARRVDATEGTLRTNEQARGRVAELERRPAPIALGGKRDPPLGGSEQVCHDADGVAGAQLAEELERRDQERILDEDRRHDHEDHGVAGEAHRCVRQEDVLAAQIGLDPERETALVEVAVGSAEALRPGETTKPLVDRPGPEEPDPEGLGRIGADLESDTDRQALVVEGPPDLGRLPARNGLLNLLDPGQDLGEHGALSLRAAAQVRLLPACSRRDGHLDPSSSKESQ